MDLVTYTCVEECDATKYLIVETENTHSKPFKAAARRRLSEQGSDASGDSTPEEAAGSSQEETDFSDYETPSSRYLQSEGTGSEEVPSEVDEADTKVRFCRPWNQKNYSWRTGELKGVRRMEYFVDGKSRQKVELGTVQYPFKNIAAGGKEIFNYIH